jgi:uncharacterized membrane protein YccC
MVDGKVEWKGWAVLVHSVRTAVAAVAALVVARELRLPASYWAPITTLVITQSSLGAALKVSGQRFAGTLLGATVGGLAASCFGPHLAAFGICIFLLGVICAVTRTSNSAYRFGGITLAIVMLVPRAEPAWQAAFARFAEVSVGIAVALLLAWAWPEKDAAA